MLRFFASPPWRRRRRHRGVSCHALVLRPTVAIVASMRQQIIHPAQLLARDQVFFKDTELVGALQEVCLAVCFVVPAQSAAAKVLSTCTLNACDSAAIAASCVTLPKM